MEDCTPHHLPAALCLAPSSGAEAPLVFYDSAFSFTITSAAETYYLAHAGSTSPGMKPVGRSNPTIDLGLSTQTAGLTMHG